MHRSLISLTILITSITLAMAASPAYKVETIGACDKPEISDDLKKTLQPHGIRIAGDTGVLCEIWLRQELPLKPGSSGTAYNTLANGTFVGVISYPAKAGDYRGQAVRVGTYTLRYQIMPMDGNHLGVAPGTDFLLLSPASADTSPETLPDYQKLVTLSKQAAGTNHPIPLFLTSASAVEAPAFNEADESHWALRVMTRAKPSDGGAVTNFPLAIILIGKAEG